METKDEISILISSKNEFETCIYETLTIPLEKNIEIDLTTSYEKDESINTHGNMWKFDKRKKNNCYHKIVHF